MCYSWPWPSVTILGQGVALAYDICVLPLTTYVHNVFTLFFLCLPMRAVYVFPWAPGPYDFHYSAAVCGIREVDLSEDLSSCSTRVSCKSVKSIPCLPLRCFLLPPPSSSSLPFKWPTISLSLCTCTRTHLAPALVASVRLFALRLCLGAPTTFSRKITYYPAFLVQYFFFPQQMSVFKIQVKSPGKPGKVPRFDTCYFDKKKVTIGSSKMIRFSEKVVKLATLQLRCFASSFKWRSSVVWEMLMCVWCHQPIESLATPDPWLNNWLLKEFIDEPYYSLPETGIQLH